VLVGPARRGQIETAQAAIAVLGVDVIPFELEAPIRLAALRAETGLKMPDCCVLLAADAAAAEGVLTFDDALAREAERLGLGSG